LPGIVQLLRNPGVLTYNTKGRGHHVVELDPTVEAQDERDLTPGGEDMPAGHRRTEEISAPGYSGRKRGNVQFSRMVVAHAGLGAWLFNWIAPGNGDHRGHLAGALDAVVSLFRRLEVDQDDVIVRLDGGFGGVPSLTALIERRLPFVTRSVHQVMSIPEVRERLAGATWIMVPDAEVSGMRSATELGLITLEPSADTLRDDGTPYAPVTVRAVVSRI